MVDEARFYFSGPHIKQVCNQCGAYVKFFQQRNIPDVTEIKLRIWAITNDESHINACKSEVGFPASLDGLPPVQKKMLYWRLYLVVREHESKKEASV